MVSLNKVKLCSYGFYFEKSKNKDTSIIREDIKKMITWCDQNCKSQWATIEPGATYDSNISMSFHANTLHTSPIDESYPSAVLTKKPKFLIVFEDEADALGFKLAFDQGDINDNSV